MHHTKISGPISRYSRGAYIYGRRRRRRRHALRISCRACWPRSITRRQSRTAYGTTFRRRQPQVKQAIARPRATRRQSLVEFSLPPHHRPSIDGNIRQDDYVDLYSSFSFVHLSALLRLPSLCQPAANNTRLNAIHGRATFAPISHAGRKLIRSIAMHYVVD